ncbi:MAG: DUF177 domain-containing protein [Thermomicrobiales bacterium]
MDLKNDTVINVAQLMKDDIGSARKVHLSLNWFALDQDLMAKDVTADARLTRITHGILASGRVAGIAMVECARCLELYDQPFEADFDQEYRPTIDVRSGVALDQPPAGEEYGTIDASHELNLAEPIRQVAILDLPIKPVCHEDCAGLGQTEFGDDDEGDRRLGVLGQLLEHEDEKPADE